jgi:DNA helicase HerA-like ATPase
VEIKKLPLNEWLNKFNWKPGQHIAILSRTGSGKTNLAFQLLEKKLYVVIVDIKPNDTTLQRGAKKFGYKRIHYWIPFTDKIKLIQGKKLRLLLTPKSTSKQDFDKHLKEVEKCLEDVIHNLGKFTIYIDELQVLSDRSLGKLYKPVEKGMILSRANNVSILTSTQAPRFVPIATTDQASYVFVSKNRDTERLKTIATRAGVNGNDLISEVNKLKQYEWLVIPDNNFEPIYKILPNKI